jgi:hypothetical protein
MLEPLAPEGAEELIPKGILIETFVGVQSVTS